MVHARLRGAAVVEASPSESHFFAVHGESLKRSLATRFVLVFLLLLASTAGLSGYPSPFVIQAAAATPNVSECVVQDSGGQTTCTCVSTDDRDPKELQATLSSTKSVLQLVCQTGLTCAPDELTQKQVCPENTPDLTKCKNDQGNPKCIDVTTLLAGSAESIGWEAVPEVKNVKAKKLSIPRENLPYSDKKFIVGCLSTPTTNNTAKCKLTVTLEARASVTDKHTVTCAYGKTSNPTHQTVKLSPSQNRFTLVCGSEGEVLPTDYKSTYCFSEEGGNAAKTCGGNYTEVIPAYESSWWNQDSSNHSFSLVIPQDSFPEEETKIVVGCGKKATGSVDRSKKETSADSSSVCSVEVTIEGVTSSASLSVDTAGAFSLVVGFASLLTGLGCVL
ncbi:SAG3 protein, related [Neospora caninum Liverpool]|uniref:Srs domain-containing protein n=1 Tax=Neospora caninum (strain Liverpool) TaxID=572307 RepID=F0VAV8_NEOCL|nr:SAG3 protein, related [Neospora caninum Liverpool]CBZ50816.1 SAG3 protein, related [Neospora caninum Liverpool]CEL68117.1 TPA: SAG3 protein, related [Neospora caninum Liverpool]|eukprot:XP_003880849.1 SAG3 protein, related [Neospora caninum Liverpool]